jgi:uncharacterized protein YkwD
VKTLLVGVVCVVSGFGAEPTVRELSTQAVEPGILRALNQLRADPAGYAVILTQRREYYNGYFLEIPGHGYVRTQEGVRPLDEAIAALQSIHAAIGRVALSEGLSRAAADHVLDTGRRGLVGHTGADGSDPTQRMARHGVRSGVVGEAISYGPNEGREVIAQLLIDDGVANRGHRKSLLDPRWRYAGIACGFHGRFGTMCVIDFI